VSILLDREGSSPVPTARDGASALQKSLASACALALLAASLTIPIGLTTLLSLLLMPLFLVVTAVQLSALFQPSASYPQKAVPADNGQPWPIYSILVPLYHEARVVDQLLAALSALDYPPQSLDVIILLEPDDQATPQALMRHGLPDWIRVVVMPFGHPQTKPRALNHGLQMARGQYLTVYDAEDIPDADQLKRAVIAFEELEPEAICLQARLAIDNGPDSWFALMMSIEYAALFDVHKRGLMAQNMPVMLGGTSNHFRRARLLELGGWDSWNVTEDADLGIRIARRGWLVADLDSTTLEEAPLSFGAWFGQRKRWLKGWAQTTVCHNRRPVRAVATLGMVSWLVAMAQLIGVLAGALSFPVFVIYIVQNLASGELLEAQTWGQLAINSLALSVLALGMVTMSVPAIIGLQRRRAWHLTPWILTLPVYLFMISLAAWCAMWELARRPFHWEKTEHGLGRRRPQIFKSRHPIKNRP
jgi:glycosyltransferase XagB